MPGDTAMASLAFRFRASNIPRLRRFIINKARRSRLKKDNSDSAPQLHLLTSRDYDKSKFSFSHMPLLPYGV